MVIVDSCELRKRSGIDAFNHQWAVTCAFQQCGILTSVDSDEPVQPPF